MSNSRDRLAQALAGFKPSDNPMAGSPAAYDSQGLQTPPEVTQLLTALLMPPLSGSARNAMAAAPQRLASEAGSLFPEAASEALPAIEAGAKTGDPHALFAYHDDFGPGMTKRAIYNVFGNPSHPAVQGVGWGSSVPQDVLQKYGIPVIGKQAARLLK